MTANNTIVVVEDDKFLLRLYQTKLAQEGFTVKTASDGDKAVSLIRDILPAAVLLDVDLPKKDGFTVLARLKDDSATSSIPVVILTNLSSQADVEQARQIGAADYLIKAHFLPQEVVAKVKSLAQVI